MLSEVIVTPRIERNVVGAFKELHRHNVYHGDVRAANIIVRPDESVVLIDFERSVLNADRMMLIEEEDEVRHMLQVAKNRIIQAS
jgi:tRNA A-37 threonylcarbamoyl transferase component Bud32